MRVEVVLQLPPFLRSTCLSETQQLHLFSTHQWHLTFEPAYGRYLQIRWEVVLVADTLDLAMAPPLDQGW